MLDIRKIDHIVYAVPDLEAAMDQLEQTLGVRPLFGGYHTTQGTKNAVLHLGHQCYLELLATDFENKQCKAPRWMGVDFIDRPQVTRWSLRSTQLQEDRLSVKQYHMEMGSIQGGQRKKTDGQLLTWEMIMPLAAPAVEIVPFMTDWQHSVAHPTDSLPQVCQLISMEFTHPQPQMVTPTMDQLGIDLDLIKSQKISIKANIQSPNGLIQI